MTKRTFSPQPSKTLATPAAPQVDRAQSILRKAKSQRRFDAAGYNNALSNWVTGSLIDFNEELRTDLPTLRARSRDAAINDVYARSYFDALKSNVVGPTGITLKMDITTSRGKSDIKANRIIQEMWEDYSKEVTTDGMNLRDTLKLFIEAVAKEGEVFIVKRRGPEFGKHMIQLQIFEAEYCDVDFNGKSKTGNLIRSGIEYNNYGKPVAYWLFKTAPKITNALTVSPQQTRIRFDAKDVIHGFDRERVGQGRGFPWLSSALENLTHVREYQKSELIAARVASAKMGFYTRPRGENDLLGDGEDPNDNNAFMQEADPGMFDILPDGYSLETFDPQNPNGNFPNFIKAILKGIAASVGVAYHTISNDLESTSYSSLRQGAIDERDTYRGHQQWMIDKLLQPLFEEWLGLMLAFGNQFPKTTFAIENYDQLNKPVWKPRVWQWIDPGKETQAIKVQLDYKLRSHSDIARALGTDYDEVLREIADERAYAESLGIDLDNVDVAAAIAPTDPNAADSQADDPNDNNDSTTAPEDAADAED